MATVDSTRPSSEESDRLASPPSTVLNEWLGRSSQCSPIAFYLSKIDISKIDIDVGFLRELGKTLGTFRLCVVHTPPGGMLSADESAA